MATIDDIGGDQPLGNPPLGGPSGWAAAVRDAITGLQNNAVKVTHPNTDDVLVQAWDAGKARWQTVHYDSGWRDVASLWQPGFSGTLTLRRRDNGVDLTIVMPTTTPTLAGGWNVIAVVPAGFRPAYQATFAWFNGANTVARGYIDPTSGNVNLWGGGATASAINASVTMPTNNAIPTSLPGTLVSAAPTLLPAPTPEPH